MLLCYVEPMNPRFVLAAGVALFLAVGISEAARPFPKDAQLATLEGSDPPNVNLDGQWKQLAPGALVYDTANRILPPPSIPTQGAVVVQYEATTGFVARLWILSDDEAAGFAASR